MVVIYHRDSLAIAQVSANLTSLSPTKLAQGYRLIRVPKSMEIKLRVANPSHVIVQSNHLLGFSSEKRATSRERKLQKSLEGLTDPKVVICRQTRGLGDAIMLESVVSQVYDYLKLNNPGSKLFLMIKESLYPVFYNLPYPLTLMAVEDYNNMEMLNFTIFDVSKVCADYETAFEPAISKNRPEIWCEHIGILSDQRSPRIYLTPEECSSAWEVMRNRFEGKEKIIGIGYKTYDKWRDYDNIDWLIKELSKLDNVGICILDKSKPSAQLPSNVIHFNTLSLRELFSYVYNCDLIIAPDTAHVHIAGSLGVPMYSIFGPTDPFIRLSCYNNTKMLSKPFTPCKRQPCWYHPCKERFCLSTLGPKTIVSQVKDFLGI